MDIEVSSLANQLLLVVTDYALNILGALLLLIAGWLVLVEWGRSRGRKSIPRRKSNPVRRPPRPPAAQPSFSIAGVYQ